MLHRLTIGHLDPDAVAQRRVVVTRPHDPGIVTQLLLSQSYPEQALIGERGGQAASRSRGR
jgi:hypothetical protein